MLSFADRRTGMTGVFLKPPFVNFFTDSKKYFVVRKQQFGDHYFGASVEAN
jgi:hypothetical protein